MADMGEAIGGLVTLGVGLAVIDAVSNRRRRYYRRPVRRRARRRVGILG